MQRRFEKMVAAARSDLGFFYPHSGNRVSSRTNAILYDALSVIREDASKNSSLQLAGFVTDRFRLALGSRVVAVVGAIIAAGISGYAILSWLLESRSLEQLAPELISSVLIFLLAFRKHT